MSPLDYATDCACAEMSCASIFGTTLSRMTTDDIISFRHVQVAQFVPAVNIFLLHVSSASGANDFLDDIKKMYRTEFLNSLKFNYFTPDAFNDMISKENDICLSLFHMNIRSLNKNNEELFQFLNTLNYNFDVLVLSEVWTHNIALYNNLLPGYNFYCDLPLSSDVGGVGIYVKSSLLHCIVSSYNIVTSVDCPVENLWLEVTKNSSKYIIGGVYRHPGYKISKFIEQMDNILTQTNNCKTPCFIAGDINIDLKKYQYHQDTKVYLDTLIMNNFTPAVVMPTTITDRSVTLIDHICY